MKHRDTAQLAPFDIRSLQHLSRRLGVPVLVLQSLSEVGDNAYRTWCEPKKSGGLRQYAEPIPELKHVQRRIHRRLLSGVPSTRSAHGGVKTRSIVTSARRHVGRYCVLTMDIADFFPSCHPRRVYAVYRRIGCVPRVASLLTRLTTWNYQLPQGAPTSTALCNLMLADLDRRFEGLARKHHLRYTRFVDDIVVSAEYDFSGLRTVMEKIVRQEGFQVKPSKVTRRYSHEQQRQLGLTTNSKLSTGRRYVRDLRMLLHAAKRDLTTKPMWNEMDYSHVRRLRGRVRYVEWINPRAASPLKRFSSALSAPDGGRRPTPSSHQ